MFWMRNKENSVSIRTLINIVNGIGFGVRVYLLLYMYYVCATSIGYGETAYIRRLVIAIACRKGLKQFLCDMTNISM